MKNITRREFLKKIGYVAGSVLLAESILSKTSAEQHVKEYSLKCEACGKNLTDKAIVSVYGGEASKIMGPQEDKFYLYVDQSKIHYACPGERGVGGDCSKKVDYNNMAHEEIFPGMMFLTGGAILSLIDVQEFFKAREPQTKLEQLAESKT
jgi:hypothetical protein